MKKKLFIVFGTRPELVKMAPLVREGLKSEFFQIVTCASGQHRDLLDQMLAFFEIRPDYDLNLMKENQDLFDLTSAGIAKMRDVLAAEKPDYVLVHGDTTTALIAALSAFYLKIPIAHIEAGLRTYDRYSPYPEEMNRRLIAPLANAHFAPTEPSARNLRNEGYDNIYIVGNTAIDSLKWAVKASKDNPYHALYRGKKMVLMTAHRRENFGPAITRILQVVRTFAERNPDFHFLYPVHPNPNAQAAAKENCAGVGNISLVEPVDYGVLVQLLKDAHLVVTDSGGLQEEAVTLQKPVLILRESTERPEVVDNGAGRLVGSNPEKIRKSLEELKDVNSPLYRSMTTARNPFGDGKAAKKILYALEEIFTEQKKAA